MRDKGKKEKRKEGGERRHMEMREEREELGGREEEGKVMQFSYQLL